MKSIDEDIDLLYSTQSVATNDRVSKLELGTRRFTIHNQSVPKAYEFTSESGDEDGSRLMAGGNRDRLVNCTEELMKYTVVVQAHFDLFGDRYSERKNVKVSKASAVNGVKVGSI